MSYFLTKNTLILGQEVKLVDGELAHMLGARRVKVGEVFKLQDPNLKRFLVKAKEIGKNYLNANVIQEIPVPKEPKIFIELFQSIISEQALDLVLQKSTELGVAVIVLFNSQNTARKLNQAEFEKKQVRWNKILWEAAKQCERVKPPELKYSADLAKVMAEAGGFDKIFLCDITGDKFSVAEHRIKNCGIVVGPEGGFAEQEIAQIKALPNCRTISLGPYWLRTETASLAALAILRNIYE